MLQIIPTNFVRAAAKAAEVKPTVVREFGNGYFVRGQYTVRFTAMRGGLWASCDCPAGTGDNRRAPMPCYHVAAVLQSPRGNVSFEAQAHNHECECGNKWSCESSACWRDYTMRCINCLGDGTPGYPYDI